jgi:AbiV family abortive infection protein
VAAPVDSDSIALGACYAIDHAQTLLEDAAALYSHKRASGAFHLAVMAREELGRFNLLADRYHKLSAGEFLDAKKLAQSLQPHKVKLLAGQSTVPVPMTTEQLAEWSAAIRRNDEQTISAISKDVRLRAQKLKPHQAAELHQRRLKAQYVDLDPQTGRWSQPSSVSMLDASMLIRTVVAEIANALIGSQGVDWIHSGFQVAGMSPPQMGPFTHRIYGHLGAGDA